MSRHYSGRTSCSTGSPWSATFGFLTLLVVAATWSTEALAISVEVTETQQQTVIGQAFTFSVDATDGLLLPVAGQGGSLLFEFTNVDLSAPSPFETFTYDIESLVVGGPIGGSDLDSISDSTTVTSINGAVSFEIGAAALAQILDDRVFTTLLDFSANVGFNNRDPVLVSLTLAYEGELDTTPVPVPAAAWLFGSALAMLGWVRSRTIA